MGTITEPERRSALPGPIGQNGVVPPRSTAHRQGRPARLLSAVFQPIGDEGRASLVERRIADAIRGGVLHAGEKLPSEQELAQTFGVAPATVREALLSLRSRGLLVTRRGRGGGSFVADSADPMAFTTEALLATTRVSLRDAATHYLAITRACVELAARRADPSEVELIRARVHRAHGGDLRMWRRIVDDAVIELAALSQSARLTREQMRLQAELSPFFALIDQDEAEQRRRLEAMDSILNAVAEADASRAGNLVADAVAHDVTWLIDHRAELEAQ
ncbi:FadR/GntR family transcriptional regulator [Microcella alkaliphila]|jgi:DNA-binding FadR family transcriptional regulator|uniref:FadR/GntR family transcriptional regulator n=1 Tax=Microcella alkaliphila TaxID=279828 RepID=UPI000BBB071A|nr:GntR family transcriptional regulator [Microcella alkaliphila]